MAARLRSVSARRALAPPRTARSTWRASSATEQARQPRPLGAARRRSPPARRRDRACRPPVGGDECLPEVRDEPVDQPARRHAFDERPIHRGRDRCSRPLHGVDQHLLPAAGKVMLERSAWRIGVGEHLRERRPAQPLLAQQQGGAPHHPSAGIACAAHAWSTIRHVGAHGNSGGAVPAAWAGWRRTGGSACMLRIIVTQT